MICEPEWLNAPAIATGRASIIREPERLKVRVLPVRVLPVAGRTVRLLRDRLRRRRSIHMRIGWLDRMLLNIGL
jgi:hypothetical protein